MRSRRNPERKSGPVSAKKAAGPLICHVAVLGSGTVKEGSPVYKKALLLGKKLAKEGITVYHGGYGGVMEAVSRGVKDAGGHSVGVTIGKSLRGANPWVGAEIKAPSWKERLFKLIEKGQAYIFLDGATGTLNELFFVWEMANKKLHKKPIIILGRRLHRWVKTLQKDPLLKIPENLHLAPSIPHVIKKLTRG